MARIEVLDYFRFWAAIFVLLFHYTFNGITNGKIESISHIPQWIDFTKYGYLGVELFFMVSGYVIFYSAQNRSPSKFLLSRAVRLFPSYWFAVILTSIVTVFLGTDLINVEFKQVLFNLTMLQSYFYIGHVDGVYWTLVYEVQFYFAIFIILAIGQQKRLIPIFIAWPLIMLLANLFNYDETLYLGGYFYYFSAGSLLAIFIQQKGNNKMTWVALSIAFFLCLNFSLGKLEDLSQKREILYSKYVVFIYITSFFALFLSLQSKFIKNLTLPFSSQAGALTYPLYLVHAHIGYMIINFWGSEENKLIIYSITFLTVLFIAYVMNEVIEKRLKAFWYNLFSIMIESTTTIFKIASFRKFK